MSIQRAVAAGIPYGSGGIIGGEVGIYLASVGDDSRLTVNNNGDIIGLDITGIEYIASSFDGAIISATKAVESPDTSLVDPANFTIIAQKRIGDTSETVLSFHLRTNPWIRNVDHWYRLEGAGAGSTDRMVTYRRAPTKLELMVPQDFEMLPVQEEGLEFVINTHSRIGGTLIYKPLSLRYTDVI